MMRSAQLLRTMLQEVFLLSDWISGNRYLNNSEVYNNAEKVYTFFGSRGYSDNAVAAILGNMWRESTVNPGIWEELKPYRGGYGLCQWTPYTKYSNWAGRNWQNNGDLECQYLDYSLQYNWFRNSDNPQYVPEVPPISVSEFITSDIEPWTLAMMFCAYYEHPKNPNDTVRGDKAFEFYNWITGGSVTPPPIDPTPPDDPNPPVADTDIPIWMLFKIAKRSKRLYN